MCSTTATEATTGSVATTRWRCLLVQCIVVHNAVVTGTDSEVVLNKSVCVCFDPEQN
jgi:hypothetical protein